MTVALNDLFAVTAVGECFNQRIMLTAHYAVIVVGTSTVEAVVTSDLIDSVRAGGGQDVLESDYLACLPPEYNLVRWVAQKIAPVRYAYQFLNRGEVGTHANSTETANQAGVITLRTVLAGRQNISNKHIGPLPQDVAVQDSGLLTVAYKALLNTLGVQMVTQITGGGTATQWAPVVRHNSPLNSFTYLSQTANGDTVNTMRRRTVGRGI